MFDHNISLYINCVVSVVADVAQKKNIYAFQFSRPYLGICHDP